MLPSTSPMEDQLIKKGLEHSQKFLTEVNSSLCYKTRVEDLPVHLEWKLIVPPEPGYTPPESPLVDDDGIRVVGRDGTKS